MTIIIGAGSSAPTETSPLPPPPADLPHPGSAKEAHRFFDAAKIAELLRHESSLVRAYALEQSVHCEDASLVPALLACLNDEDATVAMEATGVLAAKKEKQAIPTMLERFKTASGELAAGLASALGQLAPEQLLGAVKARGRLDDEAYAATATALAIIGSGEVIEFLDKALSRAAALPPERRSALYGSALLSGHPGLGARVLSQAIDDSAQKEQPGASFPSRAALAVVAGVPMPYSAQVAGVELYDHAREELELETYPALLDDERAALEEAVKTKKADLVLAALAPVLNKGDRSGAIVEDEDLGTMPKRRRGLLEALIERRVAIGRLELSASAIFVAAAARACSVILAGGLDEAESPALVGLAKTLEQKPTAAELAKLDLAGLTQLFSEKSDREMRRVLTILVREPFRRPGTLRRFAKAVVESGHVRGLLEAASEIEDPRVQAAVLKVLSESPAKAEPVLVEVLSASPLEDKLAALALLAAEDVRTERLGLVIGRRFNELRALSRASVARAIMRIGDPRLLPVIESRAFPDEVEELSWVVLSLAHGVPGDERLQKAVARVSADRDGEPQRPEVRVPMKCKRCGEVLAYGFERVLLDVDAKDQWGDPAFVGELRCKACGATDQLEPVEEAARILTAHLMQSLEGARAGVPTGPTLVAPAATEVHGKRMGMAAALRALDEEVTRSPESIRARLHRARIRLILKRPGVEEDLQAVLQTDGTAVEADALLATILVRKNDPEGAVQKAAEVVRRLIKDPDVRLYDAPTADSLREGLEEYLLELEGLGLELPADLELAEARERRENRAAVAAQAEQIARERRAPREAPEPRESAGGDEGEEGAAIRKQVGRNDPCPCGSGKKYKKCHGANV
jgi:hypothetical protein